MATPIEEQASIIADLHRDYTKRLRADRGAIVLLEDARCALNEGRLEVVAEFIDRVLDKLERR